MADRMIVLAAPNRVTVHKGEFALIEMNLAEPGAELAIAELPERTVLELGGPGGSEVRWAGPTTLIYRAPDLPRASSDRFRVRHGDGVHLHYVVVDHAGSRSPPAEQARLRAIFEAAPPTILIDGKGLGKGSGGSAGGADHPDRAAIDARWPGLFEALAERARNDS